MEMTTMSLYKSDSATESVDQSFRGFSGVLALVACALAILGFGAGHSLQAAIYATNTYPFSAYTNRPALLADGWSFIARSANGGLRDTEITDTNVGAVVSYDQNLHPGVIRIPADVGDFWGGFNNSRNSLFRNLPTNWVSVRLKHSFAPTQNTQQINLLAYQDDDNYVAVSHSFNGIEQIAMANEQGFHSTPVGSIGVTAVGLHLRLVRDLDTGNVTGYYSQDGSGWSPVGTTWQALINPKVAIFVGGSPSGFPNASLEQLEIVTQDDPPLAQFMLQPQNLVFNAVAGQALTNAQDLYLVVRSQDSDVNWTVTNTASWLKCAGTNGATPSTCYVSVDTTGLPAGVYQAALQFSSPGAVSATANVTLIVNPAERVGLANWKGGKTGAMSLSTDDSYISGFSNLLANGLSGTFLLMGVNPIPPIFTDVYGAGMELGGHSVDHYCFDLNDGALRYQLETNISNIMAVTPVSQSELISFAYPCGFNTTRYRVVTPDYYLAIRGYNINQLEDAKPASFACLKSYNSHNYPPNPPADFKTLVDAAIAQGKWFNLVLHEFSNDDGAFAYSVGKDIWVDAMGRVAKYIQLRERTVITNYSETTNQIQFSSYRLPLNSTSKRNFELAVTTNDVVTFKVGVADLSNSVSAVIVNGVGVAFTNAGSYVYFDARVTTNSQTITLSLQPNTPPALGVLSNRSELELAALVITNTAVDADVPAQTLIYTLTGTNVLGGAAVMNASISANGIISWTPTEMQGPGQYVFVTRVTDVATPPLSATNFFTITVDEVNAAPVLPAQPNRTVIVSIPLLVTNAATDVDLPANPLTYELVVSNLNTGSIVTNASINANGVISWTPASWQVGTTNRFTTVVTDTNSAAVASSSLKATNAFTVVVLSSPLSLPAQSSVSIDEQSPLTALNPASDFEYVGPFITNSIQFTYPDRNALLANGWSFMATNPNGSGRNTEITDTNLGAVISYNQTVHPGALRIQTDIGDQFGNFNNSRNCLFRSLPTNWVSLRFQMTFAPVQDTDQAHLTIYQDDNNYVQLGLVYNSGLGGLAVPFVSEVNGVADHVWANLAATTNIYLRMDRNPGNQDVTGFFSVDGTNWVSLGVYPQSLLNARVEIWASTGQFGVAYPAATPVCDARELIILETNPPIRSISYALENPPSGAQIGTDGTISWTPTEAQGPGVYTLKTVVWDNALPQIGATNSFTVTVNEVNVAPVLNLPANTNILALTPWTGLATASDSDAPTNALAFDLISGPQGLTLASSGLISWTPDANQSGSSNLVQIRLTDTNSAAVNPTSFSVTNSFTITVGPVLTVTANNTSRVYGAENPAFSVNYSGFVDGDTPSNLQGSLILSTPATTGSSVGTYPIYASGLASDKYVIVYLDGQLVIAPSNAPVVLGNLAAVYDGAAKSASVTTVPAGLLVNVTYAGSANAPTNVGSYEVIGTISDLNYVGSVTNTLVIAASNAPVVLGNLAAVYDGSAKSASVTTVPSGLIVNLTYAGSVNAPTNVGSYEVIGTISDLNYAGSVTNTVVIAASNAPIVLGNLAAVYDGSAKSASVTTVPSGLTVNLTYAGSVNAPTNVGSYEVIGTISDLNYAGSVTNTLVIAPSNAPIVLGNLAAVYDGSAKSASVTTVPSGLLVNLTYSGNSSAPTNVGSYEVIGTISDLNYAGSATNTLVIAASNAPVVLGNLAAVYDGAAKSASVTTVPAGLLVNVTYAGSANAPTNVGSYEVIGTISDLNYVGSVTNTLVIAASNAVVTLAGLNQIYNGTARIVTATTVPSGLSVVVTYNGLSSAPTNAGTYQVIGTINALNYAGSVTNTLTVTQPDPIVLAVNVGTPGTVVVSWNSVSGQTYRVQYKNDLNDTNWTDLPPDITATGSVTTLTNVVGGESHRFFRVYAIP